MTVRDDLDPHDMLVRAVPRLQRWRDQLEEYRDDPTSFYSLLAREVIQLAEGDAIPSLRNVALGIERLLETHDAADAVSFGFIEELQALVEAHGLAARRVRDALGPRAQGAWESLYCYRHQGHYREIDFVQLHIDGPVGGPARVEEWLLSDGAHALADQSIGHLRIGEQRYELAVVFGCYLGRRAVEAGDALPVGSMLLHVLPDVDAQIKPPYPYARLVPAAPPLAASEKAPHVVV